MFKKMLPWLIMILIAITLITIAAFVLWNFFMKEPAIQDPNENAHNIANEVETQSMTAVERSELTYTIQDITTNLSDINYIVRITFALLVENEEVKDELELVDPEIQDIIGNILADTSPGDISGSTGRDELKAKLLNELNNAKLQNGNVLEINISDLIISQR